MKQLNYLAKLLLFWFGFFIFQQVLFIFFNSDSYTGSSSELFECVLLGLRMNLAGILFILALPVLFLILSFWGLAQKIALAVIKWETLIIIVIATLLCTVDIGIYKAWGTKFNAKALAYLAFPKDVFPLLYAKATLFLFPVILLELIFFFWWRKKMLSNFEFIPVKIPLRLVLSILLVVGFIIGVRGGTQKIPLNRNQVFYSKHSLLNYAAMNSFWNFADLLFHPIENTKNPYLFYDQKLAQTYFQDFNCASKDTSIQILTSTRPNLVLIFLESWTADVVECVGGEKGVAPKYSELAKEGMLFTNFYSSGFRTEQGLLAMLSAFPAQPQGSVIYSWGKFDKLPNLYNELDSAGYATSFYYGGRLQFDNVEAYLRSGGAQRMVGEHDYPFKKKTIWGAYDEEIFDLHLSDLQKSKQPFFSMLGTITTHEWWDTDVPVLFKDSKSAEADKYRNTVHYSDSCLYAYIKAAQKQDWYKNTLFILVADHGCRVPQLRNNYDVGRHHIPMLLLGGALKPEYQGKINDRIASHTDLAATLFAQLNIHSNKFTRSKNIFNPYSPAFAYYAFDNGFGIVTKNKSVIYDNYQAKDILNAEPDSLSERLIKYGKAYLQCTNSFRVGK